MIRKFVTQTIIDHVNYAQLGLKNKYFIVRSIQRNIYIYFCIINIFIHKKKVNKVNKNKKRKVKENRIL